MCAAGTGAIYPSVGFIDTQNSTQPSPFLIFGQVWYEDGTPCNNPIVNVTNPDTGAAWYTDTTSDYNYYQTLLCTSNVSEGDVFEFNVTDGIMFNAARHTIAADDINHSEIAINLTLPQSPTTADRGVTSEHNDSNATEPAMFLIYGWIFHENNSSACRGSVVNLTHLNTGEQWWAETHPDHHYYQIVLDAANVNECHVLRIDASKDGVPIDSTEHIITSKEISDGAAMINLNGLIDLTVSDILFPRYFCAGRNNTITAVVVNEGATYTDGFEPSLLSIRGFSRSWEESL